MYIQLHDELNITLAEDAQSDEANATHKSTLQVLSGFCTNTFYLVIFYRFCIEVSTLGWQGHVSSSYYSCDWYRA